VWYTEDFRAAASVHHAGPPHRRPAPSWSSCLEVAVLELAFTRVAVRMGTCCARTAARLAAAQRRRRGSAATRTWSSSSSQVTDTIGSSPWTPLLPKLLLTLVEDAVAEAAEHLEVDASATTTASSAVDASQGKVHVAVGLCGPPPASCVPSLARASCVHIYAPLRRQQHRATAPWRQPAAHHIVMLILGLTIDRGRCSELMFSLLLVLVQSLALISCL
jgi:hypothetical protein